MTRKHLVITRHGKPVAEIFPHVPSQNARVNPLKGSILFQGDLVSPLSPHLAEVLAAMPDVGEDADFARQQMNPSR
jgi:hypothetical protein